MPERVAIRFRGDGGKVVVAALDKVVVSEFVAGAAARLDEAAQRVELTSTQMLAKSLMEGIAPIRARAGLFADWYFSYKTSLKLMRVASSSFVRHAADPSRTLPLDEAVRLDVDALIASKYERIVLRPALHDAELQRIFADAADRARRDYFAAVQSIEADLLTLLGSETTHLAASPLGKTTASFDWLSQSQKVDSVPARFEKTPEVTFSLMAGSALVGKAAGSAAASKAVLGPLGAKAAAHPLAGKLSAPFVAKALVAGSGLTAGAAAGPVGAAVGVGVGVGIDYLLNAGVALMQRPAFLLEVESVLDATERDFRICLEAELRRAVRVWLHDTVQLLEMLDQGRTEGIGGGRLAKAQLLAHS